MRNLFWLSLTVIFGLASSCHKSTPPAPATVVDPRLTNVRTVLDAIAGTPGNGVPDSVLNHALCLAVFPAGDAERRGTVSCRKQSGSWQQPVAVRFTGTSSAAPADLLIFVMKETAREAIGSATLALGDTAAGPVSKARVIIAPVELKTATLGYQRVGSDLEGTRLEGEIVADSAAHSLSADPKYDASLTSFFNTITPSGIILHHTALIPGEEKLPASAADIDEYHASRGMDIECFGKEYHVAYHYLILADGTVEAGRPERCEGAHAPGYNSYLGISVVGDFSSEDNPKGKKGPATPSPQQTKALVRLCRELRETYNIPLQHILRHSDVAPTKCPGDRFPFRTVLSEVARGSKLIADGHTPGDQPRVPAKPRAADEPFATFRLLDQEISSLQGQLSEIKAKLAVAQGHDTVARLQPPMRRMRKSAAAIERLALRLRARYRNRPFSLQLFKRLQSRADELTVVLRAFSKAQDLRTARTKAAEVGSRTVALSLQYAAISGGYGALRCAEGESTCCEPKRSEGSSHKGAADACRWMCTPKKGACRGFLGPSLDAETALSAR